MKVEREGHWGVELIPHWYIFRRYNDFVKLDDQLRKEFPLLALDLDLPPKKWLGDNFDPVFIGKRMVGLKKFLKNILNYHEVSESSAFKRFLCLDKPPHRASSLSSTRVSLLHKRSQAAKTFQIINVRAHILKSRLIIALCLLQLGS